jgi:FkbM family methyltransferase
MITQNMSRSEVETIGRAGSTNSDTAVILSNFVLLVDSNEKSVGTHLANDGFWEAWVTSFFTFNIIPGDVVCDVGANYGYYTRLFQKLSGEMGKVFAIEANPNLCNLLRTSIEQFPMDNGATIEIINGAALDSRRQVTLNVSESLGGSSIFYDGHVKEKILVESFPLDEIISEKVDVIKLDIEGSEPYALFGMERLMRSARLVVVEITDKHPRYFLEMLLDRYLVSYIDFAGGEQNLNEEMLNSESFLYMAVLRAKI